MQENLLHKNKSPDNERTKLAKHRTMLSYVRTIVSLAGLAFIMTHT